MLKEDILSAIPCLYKDDAKVFAVVGRVIAASFKCSKEGYISKYPAEPALRVEVRRMEYAEGVAGQTFSL